MKDSSGEKKLKETVSPPCFGGDASVGLNICAHSLSVVCGLLVPSHSPTSFSYSQKQKINRLCVSHPVSPPPPSRCCCWVKCTQCYFAVSAALSHSCFFSPSDLNSWFHSKKLSHFSIMGQSKVKISQRFRSIWKEMTQKDWAQNRSKKWKICTCWVMYSKYTLEPVHELHNKTHK